MIEKHIDIEFAKTLTFDEFKATFKNVLVKYSLDAKKTYNEIRGINSEVKELQSTRNNSENNKGKRGGNKKSNNKRTDI